MPMDRGLHGSKGFALLCAWRKWVLTEHPLNECET